jgi:hypothetical protein
MQSKKELSRKYISWVKKLCKIGPNVKFKKTLLTIKNHTPTQKLIKKRIYWNTTFRTIEVTDVVLEENGKSARPFLIISEVTPRACSMLLERRVVDFSADAPFHDVPNKLLEHYGFQLSPDVIRKITLKHASSRHSAQAEWKFFIFIEITLTFF